LSNLWPHFIARSAINSLSVKCFRKVFHIVQVRVLTVKMCFNPALDLNSSSATAAELKYVLGSAAVQLRAAQQKAREAAGSTDV
jgi:hypothetical protein